MAEEKKPNNILIIVISLAAIVVISLITLFILTSRTGDNAGSGSSKQSIYGVEIDPESDFVDNFKKVPSLSKLLTATDSASLTETLRGGPYTIFAPDNDAFNKLPAATLETLLKQENKKQLTEVLTNHVVAGSFRLQDLQNNQELTTLSGSKLKIVKDENNLKIGNSKIVISDVVQKNGVAYVIDTVLVPETKEVKLTKVGGVDVSSDKDFAQNLALVPTLTTVAAAVNAGGLSSTLKTDGPFTIFVPSNSAFAKLPAGTVENLLKPENRSQLISILTYHVIPGKLLAADLKDGQELTTISGAKLKVQIQGSKVSIIGGSPNNIVTVETADVIQKNGVAHIVDSVLFPPAN